VKSLDQLLVQKLRREGDKRNAKEIQRNTKSVIGNEVINDSTVTGTWTFATQPVGIEHSSLDNLPWSTAGHTINVNIVMNDNSITGIDTLTFTDVNGTIASIENQNLLDKTATETISGAYTHSNNLSISEGNEMRWYDVGSSNYVGFKAPALTGNQIWVLPDSDGSADEIIKTDGAGTLTFVTPTVDVPINISMYDAEPARSSETNWNGGLLLLDTAASVGPATPANDFTVTTKGTGKIMIVVNAGTDTAGDITITGTSVDRNTGVQTASDTSVITINGLSTDSPSTDANGNTVHGFTKAYISDKWFYGVTVISTSAVNSSDMDIYHVSFEQLNDKANITLNTFDVNAFVTNTSCEFDTYLYTLHVTGDECRVDNEAQLHIGSVGGAKAQASLANQYYRLRQGNINESLDGTTDGFWVDVHYTGTPIGIEDVTIKTWFTETISLTLT